MYDNSKPWQPNKIDHALIELALQEDLGMPFQDVTTHTLFTDTDQHYQAQIISKHPTPVVICGLPIVKAVLDQLNRAYQLHSTLQDGQLLNPGQTLLTLEGQAATLLMAERTLLNFLQHLCAIATLTAQFVNVVKDTPLKILDTRKTLPGFRHLEKYAVFCGGGVNHRLGLYDAFMIKDTHVDLLGGMQAALARLPEKSHNNLPVIVEVRSLAELKIVLDYGRNKVTRILLDNMDSGLMAQCVVLCKDIFLLEASGNISLENIKLVAQSGVNFASIGKLTHSAGNIDLSMKCNF